MIFGNESSTLTAWSGENMIEGNVSFDIVKGGFVCVSITIQSQKEITLPFSSSSKKPIIITEEVMTAGEDKLYVKTYKVINAVDVGFMKVHGEEEDCSVQWDDWILTDNMGRKFDLVKSKDLNLENPLERMERVKEKVDMAHFVMKMMDKYKEEEDKGGED